MTIYFVDDFISFLRKCRRGLVKGGCIVIKDNVTSTHENVMDEDDSSVTRYIANST